MIKNGIWNVSLENDLDEIRKSANEKNVINIEQTQNSAFDYVFLTLQMSRKTTNCISQILSYME